MRTLALVIAISSRASRSPICSAVDFGNARLGLHLEQLGWLHAADRQNLIEQIKLAPDQELVDPLGDRLGALQRILLVDRQQPPVASPMLFNH